MNNKHTKSNTLLFFIRWLINLLKITSVTVLTLAVIPSYADYSQTEYQLKARFLYNIAKMVRWPQDELKDGKTALTFCFLGKDVFGTNLNSIKNKKFNKNTVTIKRNIGLGNSLKSCHMLFVSASERARLPNIISTLNNRPILTVSDMNDFSQKGGMVTLTKKAKKVKMVVNLQATRDTSLDISSRLLSVAKVLK